MALAATLLSTLVYIVGAYPAARWASWAGFGTFLVAGFPLLSRRDHMLLGMGGALMAATVVLAPDANVTLARCLDLAAFLTSLLLTLSLLREAARASPAVHRCGAYVLAQPPGRRYIALTLASHLFAIVLSFGVVNLFGVMAVRSNTLAAAGGEERVRKVRERRMMLAILRGQNAMVCWSPLSVLVALTLVLFPTLGWSELVTWGLPYAVLMLLLGWLVDWLEWPRRGQVPAAQAAGRSAADLVPMAIVLGSVLTLVLGLHFAAGFSLLRSVVLMGTVFAVLWLFVQHLPLGRLAAPMTARCLARMPLRAFLVSRSEVTIVSMASIIGITISALLPPHAIEGVLRSLPMPPPVVAMLMAFVVMIAGQVGINALVAVTIIGAAGQNIVGSGLTPLMCAFALLAGSALSIASSPFGSPLVMISNMTGEEPDRIGRVWNGRFTLAAFALLCVVILLAWIAG